MNDTEKKALTNLFEVVNDLTPEQLRALTWVAKGMEINENMHKAG